MKRYCRGLPVAVLACLLAACGGDYYYPSVRQDFLTALSGMDGRPETVLTDKGETFRVVEDTSDMRVGANATVRVVANYETLTTDDEIAGVKLYALLQVISPILLATDEFGKGVGTGSSKVQSIWLGHDYLNIILKVKQQGKHLFHFVGDEVSVDEVSGHARMRLTLFHDVTSAAQDYSKRACLSVPLRQYMIDGV